MNAWADLVLLEFTTMVSVWIRMNIIIHKGNCEASEVVLYQYYIDFKIIFHLPNNMLKYWRVQYLKI